MPGYTLADGVTLKNRLGASSHDELEVLQIDFVRRRLLEMELSNRRPGSYDGAHLKALHRHLFQDIFEWAGRTRDERVKLSDGSIASEPLIRKAGGKPFLEGPKIPAALDDIAAKHKGLRRGRALPRAVFAEQAADFMAELNNIHPFREGNGRTQRAFVRQLAAEAGHSLDFSVVSRERMMQASIATHEQGDVAPMRRILVEISDPSRVAPLRQAIAFFEREGFGWNDHYLATTEPGRQVEAVFAGRAGAHFIARTETEILVGEAAHLPLPAPNRGERFTLTTPEKPPDTAGKSKPRAR